MARFQYGSGRSTIRTRLAAARTCGDCRDAVCPQSRSGGGRIDRPGIFVKRITMPVLTVLARDDARQHNAGDVTLRIGYLLQSLDDGVLARVAPARDEHHLLDDA